MGSGIAHNEYFVDDSQFQILLSTSERQALFFGHRVLRKTQPFDHNRPHGGNFPY